MALTKAKFGVISSALASGNATDGYVLTADGSGNSAWEEVAGGPTHKTFGTSSIMIGDNATGTIDAANYNVGLGVDVFNDLTSGDSNIAIGFQAGFDITTGSQNVFMGYEAGKLLTTGTFNVGIGHQSFGTGGASATTGQNNTAVGYASLYSIAGSASSNTALGQYALLYTTSGQENTAVGSNCNRTATTASGNSDLGFRAGYSTTTGYSNTRLGIDAGYGNTTAYNNVFVGINAGYGCTTGAENVTMGLLAGRYMAGANYNTLLGSRAGYQITGSNNICIGAYGASNATSGSNSIYIGYNVQPSSATDSSLVIGASVSGKGNNTGYIYPPGGGSMYQATNTTTWAQNSDERIKKNIVDNNEGLSKLKDIQVRNFEYRTEDEVTELPSHLAVKKEGIQLGVIAQEIEKVLPEVVITESSGQKTINTDNLVWYLINSVKELSAEIQQLKDKLGE